MNADFSVKGFAVSDPLGMCPIAETWKYAAVTNDQDGNPQSLTGPDGIEFNLYDKEILYAKVDETFANLDFFAYPEAIKVSIE